MKYNKPTVVITLNASHTIQAGTDPTAKITLNVLDSATPRMLSTTAAYEADE
jgi:hypothetical protein